MPPDHTQPGQGRPACTVPLPLPAELEDAWHYFAALPEALPRRLILGFAPPLLDRPGPLRKHWHHAAATKVFGSVDVSSELSPAPPNSLPGEAKPP